MRLLLTIALLLAGCATHTSAQQVLISDMFGKPLAHADVNVYREPSEISHTTAKGPRYFHSVTDQHGLCMLSFPDKKACLEDTDWTIFVYTKRHAFGGPSFTEKDGRLLLYMLPFGDTPTAVRRTTRSSKQRRAREHSLYPMIDFDRNR